MGLGVARGVSEGEARPWYPPVGVPGREESKRVETRSALCVIAWSVGRGERENQARAGFIKGIGRSFRRFTLLRRFRPGFRKNGRAR